jgi:hypothetical protein
MLHAAYAFPSIPLVTLYKDENGNNLVAWWLPWNAQEYLPRLAKINLRIEGVTFENPVLVDLLDGKYYKIRNFANESGTIIFEDIPLADYPLVIVERKTI